LSPENGANCFLGIALSGIGLRFFCLLVPFVAKVFIVLRFKELHEMEIPGCQLGNESVDITE
jgi:hypothetical protein